MLIAGSSSAVIGTGERNQLPGQPLIKAFRDPIRENAVGLTVYLIFEDRERDHVEEFDDLSEAAGYALKLADEIGQRPAGDGHGPPVKVAVYRGGRLEIAIHIIRGGLGSHKGGSRLRSM